MNIMLKHKLLIVSAISCFLQTSSLIGMAQQALPVVVDKFAELKKLADQGDPEAQFKLAHCYRLGIDTQKDSQQANLYYERAADQNHGRACFHLGRTIKSTNPENARHYFQKGIADGEPLCQYGLACMLPADGHPTVQERQLLENVATSTYIARKAIDDSEYIREVTKCQSRAIQKLGTMHELGLGGLAPSYARAADCYKKSLQFDKDYDKALVSLASLYIRGDGVTRNINESKRLLGLCPATHPQAQCLLGDIYLEELNFDLARACFQHACQGQDIRENRNRESRRDSAKAAYNLGLLCEAGKGTKKDPENALALFQQAALDGYEDAITKLSPAAKTNGAVQCLFGILSRDGRGMQKNQRDALNWFDKALKNKSIDAPKELALLAADFVEAQLYLGNAYETGSTVKLDKAEAVKWFTKAALQNNARGLECIQKMAGENFLPAVLVLAELHEKGQANCKQDEPVSIEWRKKAADIGDGTSAFRVAQHYEKDKQTNLVIEWLKKASELKCEEAQIKLKTVAQDNPVAACALAELYLAGRGLPVSRQHAIELYRRASAANYGFASFTLASLIESESTRAIASADQVIALYQAILELFNKALKDGHADAGDEAARVESILTGIREANGKPEFQNFLFQKLRQNLPECCPAENLFWIARITEKVRLRCSDAIQEMVAAAVLGISRFEGKGQFARATIKVLLQYIESAEFNTGQLAETEENKRVHGLFRICRGISLLQITSKKFEKRDNFKRAEDAIQDVRVDVFNSIFREAQKKADSQAYAKAVQTLVDLYKGLLSSGKISDDMRRDNDWPDILGSETCLRKLLEYHTTDRWKNRIIRIAGIISRLDSAVQAQVLGSWSAAGHHCETRAEKETYEFYIRTLTDKSNLDKENLGLEVRIALFLAECRKKCISDLVPAELRERIHNIHYLEKRVGKLLALLGDAQDFDDQYQGVTVANAYKQMTNEQILKEVLKNYTVDAMARYIANEANKPPQESRIPYNSILKYFETLFGDLGATQLAHLYDDDCAKMTLLGAKILLHHFGYYE